MKHKKKIIIGIVIIILGAFAAWNGYWYFMVHNYYMGFTTMKNGDKLPKDPLDSYSKIIGDYSVSVEMPLYLVMRGNLSVCSVGTDESAPFLIIWPKKNGGTQYGIALIAEKNIQHQLYVDKKGNLIPSTEAQDIKEEQEKALNKHEEEVRRLLEVAHKAWDLD